MPWRYEGIDNKIEVVIDPDFVADIVELSRAHSRVRARLMGRDDDAKFQVGRTGQSGTNRKRRTRFLSRTGEQ